MPIGQYQIRSRSTANNGEKMSCIIIIDAILIIAVIRRCDIYHTSIIPAAAKLDEVEKNNNKSTMTMLIRLRLRVICHFRRQKGLNVSALFFATI